MGARFLPPHIYSTFVRQIQAASHATARKDGAFRCLIKDVTALARRKDAANAKRGQRQENRLRLRPNFCPLPIGEVVWLLLFGGCICPTARAVPGWGKTLGRVF